MAEQLLRRLLLQLQPPGLSLLSSVFKKRKPTQTPSHRRNLVYFLCGAGCTYAAVQGTNPLSLVPLGCCYTYDLLALAFPPLQQRRSLFYISLNRGVRTLGLGSSLLDRYLLLRLCSHVQQLLLLQHSQQQQQHDLGRSSSISIGSRSGRAAFTGSTSPSPIGAAAAAIALGRRSGNSSMDMQPYLLLQQQTSRPFVASLSDACIDGMHRLIETTAAAVGRSGVIGGGLSTATAATTGGVGFPYYEALAGGGGGAAAVAAAAKKKKNKARIAAAAAAQTLQQRSLYTPLPATIDCMHDVLLRLERLGIAGESSQAARALLEVYSVLLPTLVLLLKHPDLQQDLRTEVYVHLRPAQRLTYSCLPVSFFSTIPFFVSRFLSSARAAASSQPIAITTSSNNPPPTGGLLSDLRPTQQHQQQQYQQQQQEQQQQRSLLHKLTDFVFFRSHPRSQSSIKNNKAASGVRSTAETHALAVLQLQHDRLLLQILHLALLCTQRIYHFEEAAAYRSCRPPLEFPELKSPSLFITEQRSSNHNTRAFFATAAKGGNTGRRFFSSHQRTDDNANTTTRTSTASSSSSSAVYIQPPPGAEWAAAAAAAASSSSRPSSSTLIFHNRGDGYIAGGSEEEGGGGGTAIRAAATAALAGATQSLLQQWRSLSEKISRYLAAGALTRARVVNEEAFVWGGGLPSSSDSKRAGKSSFVFSDRDNRAPQTPVGRLAAAAAAEPAGIIALLAASVAFLCAPIGCLSPTRSTHASSLFPSTRGGGIGIGGIGGAGIGAAAEAAEGRERREEYYWPEKDRRHVGFFSFLHYLKDIVFFPPSAHRNSQPGAASAGGALQLKQGEIAFLLQPLKEQLQELLRHQTIPLQQTQDTRAAAAAVVDVWKQLQHRTVGKRFSRLLWKKKFTSSSPSTTPHSSPFLTEYPAPAAAVATTTRTTSSSGSSIAFSRSPSVGATFFAATAAEEAYEAQAQSREKIPRRGGNSSEAGELSYDGENILPSSSPLPSPLPPPAGAGGAVAAAQTLPKELLLRPPPQWQMLPPVENLQEQQIKLQHCVRQLVAAVHVAAFEMNNRDSFTCLSARQYQALNPQQRQILQHMQHIWGSFANAAMRTPHGLHPYDRHYDDFSFQYWLREKLQQLQQQPLLMVCCCAVAAIATFALLMLFCYFLLPSLRSVQECLLFYNSSNSSSSNRCDNTYSHPTNGSSNSSSDSSRSSDSSSSSRRSNNGTDSVTTLFVNGNAGVSYGQNAGPTQKICGIGGGGVWLGEGGARECSSSFNGGSVNNSTRFLNHALTTREGSNNEGIGFHHPTVELSSAGREMVGGSNRSISSSSGYDSSVSVVGYTGTNGEGAFRREASYPVDAQQQQMLTAEQQQRLLLLQRLGFVRQLEQDHHPSQSSQQQLPLQQQLHDYYPRLVSAPEERGGSNNNNRMIPHRLSAPPLDALRQAYIEQICSNRHQRVEREQVQQLPQGQLDVFLPYANTTNAFQRRHSTSSSSALEGGKGVEEHAVSSRSG